MPRKPFDARILMLAQHCTTEVTPYPALRVRPENMPPLGAEHVEEPWDWADVTVSVTFAGQTAEAKTEAVSFASRVDYLRSESYQKTYAAALSALLAKLDKTADALATLGPRRVEHA